MSSVFGVRKEAEETPKVNGERQKSAEEEMEWQHQRRITNGENPRMPFSVGLPLTRCLIVHRRFGRGGR